VFEIKIPIFGDRSLAMENTAFLMWIRLQLAVGYCDMTAYILLTGYANYECCYDDHNSGSAKRTELTKRDATTTYFSLRNA
jgi:hypothetical protein